MAKTAAKKKAATSRKPARMASSIRIKRVYDETSADDGQRILIDRLWPRGISKSALKLDTWAKDLSPSNELRKWYSHDPAKFAEFRKRYLVELKAQAAGLEELRARVKGHAVTLLTATKELDLSHGTVLREVLQDR